MHDTDIPAAPGEIALRRLPETMRRCGIARSHLYALIARGEFPQPVKIGARTVAWSSSEIDAWIAERLAERAARVVRPEPAALAEARAQRRKTPARLPGRAQPKPEGAQ